MNKEIIVTLVDCRDAYNFSIGMPIEMTFGANGQLRVATRWERFGSRMRRLWRRVTWWRQTRTQVSAIDHENGCITAATLRWSWRRWKWVRNA